MLADVRLLLHGLLPELIDVGGLDIRVFGRRPEDEKLVSAAHVGEVELWVDDAYSGRAN